MTLVQYEQHVCNTGATRVRHDTSAKRKRHEKGNERLQGEEEFHSINYILEMPRFHVKMRLKKAPHMLNIVMARAIPKSYTLDYSGKCSSRL